jgi:hypothetical protein
MNKLKDYFQERRLRGFLPSLFIIVQLVCNMFYMTGITILIMSESVLAILLPIFLLIVVIIEIYVLTKIYKKWSIKH